MTMWIYVLALIGCFLKLPTTNGAPPIRVVNGDNSCSGRVEIFYNGRWGTVCDDNWGMNDAQVVCRQLGCGEAISALSQAYFGQGSGTTWLDDVACRGTESSITQCPHSGFGNEDCSASEDAGVVCAVQNNIRLTAGDAYCSGRVEVYYDDQWGTVCDDGWDISDAEVVCRQLGCGQAVKAPGGAHFGQGSGATWLDDVDCVGNERYLTQCPHNGFGKENCDATEDAGVVCVGNMKMPNLSLLTANTALLPGESVKLKCSITSHRPMTANFTLYRTGTSNQRESAEQMSVTFNLFDLTSSDTGSYTCDYFYQGERNASSIQSNAITITVVDLHQPGITCSAPEGGLSREPGGPHITKGYSFTITCSTAPQFPGGAFHLRFAGSNSSVTIEPAVNHSASFYFPAADLSHQGNYSCVYQVELSSRQFYSMETEKLAVIVQGGCDNVYSKMWIGAFTLIGCLLNLQTANGAAPIRLVDGATSCSGRVEVYYRGQWGTVCDDRWDLSDAEVVCRQLGCGEAISAPGVAHFGEGSGKIWLDEVRCLGVESSITDCSHNGFGNHDCSASEDAGVECSDVISIRVVNGDNSCSGRVEIYNNEEWGTICDDSWDMKDAQVVCRQLGCGEAITALSLAYFGQGSGTTWLDDVGCKGTENSIAQCPHNGFGVENCGAHEDAGVVCTVKNDIQLVDGGDAYCSGRVEVYHSDQWGTVCDDSWDINDAEVVCRQLGCGQAVSAPGGAHFGQGRGMTWLDEVACRGTESSITQCPHNGFGIENCAASEDAGVVCVGEMRRPNLTLLTANTAFLPGESAELRCCFTSHRPMTANFNLNRMGRSEQTESQEQTSVTFNLFNLTSSDEGSYSCNYYYQGQRNASSDQSNTVTITVVDLHQPGITCSAPEGGLSREPGGPQITKGYSFTITCSTAPQFPDGMFHLRFSGSNSSITTEPAVNHSASFYFPTADLSHQGNYSCVYQVELSSRQFYSMETEMLAVTVQGNLLPFIVAGVVGGVLLLLLLGSTYIFCTKRRQSSTARVTWECSRESVTMNTYGKRNLTKSEPRKGEDEDDDDYLSVDPQEDEDDYENVEMEDHDEDIYENVEIEDQEQDESIYANA
ncbi:deleted in malignant brain tumors 1 protein-like [Engraulis encrasicolus]|uniref:deleted in malignant brain tumors 1 protein-like n=1 Tax=Engraulis encrasicolus TaxID=184585 RepID=UPI002FD649F3